MHPDACRKCCCVLQRVAVTVAVCVTVWHGREVSTVMKADDELVNLAASSLTHHLPSSL